MKNNSAIATCVVFAFVVVLGFAGVFIWRLANILENNAWSRDEAVTTNVVCSCQNAVVLKVIETQQVKDHDSAIIAAYDSLSNELSSWMSIMGIFSVVFGLLIPIGSYLLQHKSILEEKKAIERKNREEIFKTKQKIERKIERELRPTWLFLAAQYQWNLIRDAESIKTENGNDSYVISVGNFIIGFDHFINCICKSGNKAMMYETIAKFKPLIERFRKDEVLWLSVKRCLKNRFHPDNENFVKGLEISRMFEGNNGTYIWLKGLYDEIIPWKFSS